jgi:hypothetical protein
MPDFPDRNIDGATGLFSEQAGSKLNGDYVDHEWTGVYAGIQTLEDAWADIVNFFKLPAKVPRVPLPPIVPEDEDDDCEKLVIAVNKLTVTLERQTTAQTAAAASHNLGLAAIAIGLARIQQTLIERLSHKDFQKGAIIDLQHHLRDGFDAVCQLIAQATEARTGKKIAGADLEELQYTDPKLDKSPRGKTPETLIRAILKPGTDEKGGGNGRP